MRRLKVSVVVVAAALASAGTALAAGEHAGHAQHAETYATGEPGDAKKAARIVQVSLTEANGKMLFVPAKIEVRKDEQIRFVLRNGGQLDHEFVLGTTEENLRHGASMAKNPDMEHDDPNARRLAPSKTGDLVWRFSKAGEFEYACLIPGHREAGMVGTVVVK
ncbi:MAG: copper resistance protein [Afipia sp. 62-7]|uniref:cupredoxin domain-containing protein n=1 Tax=Tardiphaga sp. TaxID=1926292 RepID=UPI000928A00A|nr:cupredoxin family protein [Afipia sp.]OJU18458.1 MAG: copper resistance protein [Afipia sp. 62-7]OYU89382.1 MAG: copper resistance protein [Bradyrhizobiaceae bacterium PARB1]